MAEAATVTADPSGWFASQSYELDYWCNHWPLRGMPLGEIRRSRHGAYGWFLGEMGFRRRSEYAFHDFSGTVLEVGSGPIGFFELAEDVTVTSQDSLMAQYAEQLPFSTLGTRGSTTYVAQTLNAIDTKFDFVVCSNVLDHTSDWIEFLELCADRVKVRGQLLLYTDSRGVPLPGHTQIFSPQQLRRVLRLMGFGEFLVDKTCAESTGHSDFTNTIRAVLTDPR